MNGQEDHLKYVLNFQMLPAWLTLRMMYILKSKEMIVSWGQSFKIYQNYNSFFGAWYWMNFWSTTCQYFVRFIEPVEPKRQCFTCSAMVLMVVLLAEGDAASILYDPLTLMYDQGSCSPQCHHVLNTLKVYYTFNHIFQKVQVRMHSN